MIQLMRSLGPILIVAACAQGMVACTADPAASSPSAASAVTTVLPPPAHSSQVSLEETLSNRRSIREYGDQPLTMTELGQLLWAAQGITGQSGFRTAPSAGALYPLEIYLATAEGVFHYEPQRHQLKLMSQKDARPALYRAALQQEPVLRAPTVFILTAVYARTAQKYGSERSPRYVHLEAGHAAQNLLLQATALELGAVPIGAFGDTDVRKALGLPKDRQPLYLIPVGHPREPGG